mgnify:CR=1 FL=1|tara:strand:- start:91 stop:762 length:672 start_codon:yes stop_codon:yes gene_type:complete
MINKLLKKIIKHFTHPLISIFYDLRKIYYLYSWFILTKIYNVKIPKTNFLIDPDYIDLLNLFNMILKRKPLNIIEVGSGYSTLIILHAVKLNIRKYKIDCKFYSLEQDAKYLEQMKNFFTNEDLKILNFIKTDLKIINFKGENVSLCENLPNYKFNFFYEDRADHSEYKIAGDALFIEKDMPKDYFICVDGMKETVNFYKKNLERKYKISKKIFAGTNFEPRL